MIVHLSAISFVVLLLPVLARHTQHSSLTLLSNTTCPCYLTLSVTQHAPNFDLLVLHHRNASRTTAHIHPVLTNFNQSREHAIHRDALFDYHRIHIPLAIRVTLRVRPSRVAASFSSTTAFRVLSTSQRGSSCPTLLQQHPMRQQAAHPAQRPPSPTSSPVTSTRTQVQPRIVGGEPASRDLAKYMVYFLIRSAGGYRACSGTLVAPRVVITAAHCNVDRFSTAYVGGTRGSESNGVRHSIREVQVQAQFFTKPPRFNYDIAIVHLLEDAGDSAKFMKVNINITVPVDNSIVRAAGYGILRHDDRTSNPGSVLHQVDVPIVSRYNCVEAYRNRNIRVDYQFQVCAGYLGEGGCDSW